MAYRDLKGIESEINIVVPSSANGATAVARWFLGLLQKQELILPQVDQI